MDLKGDVIMWLAGGKRQFALFAKARFADSTWTAMRDALASWVKWRRLARRQPPGFKSAGSRSPSVMAPDGQVVTRFYSTWRLDADGAWRVVLDNGYDLCARTPG